MLRTFVFIKEFDYVYKNTENELEKSINKTIMDFARTNNLKEVERKTDVSLSPHGEFQSLTVVVIIVTVTFEKPSISSGCI